MESPQTHSESLVVEAEDRVALLGWKILPWLSLNSMDDTSRHDNRAFSSSSSRLWWLGRRTGAMRRYYASPRVVLSWSTSSRPTRLDIVGTEAARLSLILCRSGLASALVLVVVAVLPFQRRSKLATVWYPSKNVMRVEISSY